MNTRRYPRTMAEAFGPYTSNDLQPMREPRGRYAQDWALYVVAVIGLAVVVVVVL